MFRAFLPKNEMGGRFLEWVRRPDVVREGRRDAVAVVLLFAAAFAVWGGGWPWLLAALAGRGLLIALFDNAYHYGSAIGDPHLARNHRLPLWASAAILHFNFHGTHHRHATAPWHLLPACAKAEGRGFDGDYLLQALRQLQGPIALDDLPAAQRAAAGD